MQGISAAKKRLPSVGGLLVLVIVGLAAPSLAWSAVWVSEVAWMGDAESPNHEWIEIVNDADAPVDLTGWMLSARDGSPSLSLSGSLAPKEVAVLERTSDASAPQVAAFAIYTGALSNQGEILELRDASGAVVDVVDGSGGWAIGGNNETKETLQRSAKGTAWFTAAATPGHLSSASPGETSTTQNTTQNEVENQQTTHTADGAANSSSSAGSYAPQDAPLEEPLPWIARIEHEPAAPVAGAPVRFFSRVWAKDSGKLLEKGYWALWNFGDGTSERALHASHTYHYPGTYIATLTVGRDGSPAAITVRGILRVQEARVVVAEANPQWITLSNEGGDDVDIGGWQIVGKGTRFVFPQGSMLAARSSVRFASDVTRIAPSGRGEVALLYPNGKPVIVESSEASQEARKETPSPFASLGGSAASESTESPIPSAASGPSQPSAPPAQTTRNTSARPSPIIKQGTASAQSASIEAEAAQHDPASTTIDRIHLAASAEGAHLPAGYATLALLAVGGAALAWFFGGLLSYERGAEDASAASPHPFANASPNDNSAKNNDVGPASARETASRYTLFP
ncbi:MAG: hypothetical protein KatS3mg099_377 [Candidatus Parcubacteria bacterium]|nr:MAG: hypothetical protein KatS3mg099_377 [Candidatus Parcubacteria bacterium]